MHRKAIVGGSLALAFATALLVAPSVAAQQGAKGGSAAGSPGLGAFGLTTSQRLVSFDLDDPEGATGVGRVSGLTGADRRIVGMDFRVQDGQLYGVGDGGGVYVIDTGDASASLVSQLTVALDGTAFGVDFNPAADRLRIISDTGQNLRHDVNPGGATTADLTLTYPPATTPATGISAAAYSNNDLDPNTGTVLYDIDPNLNQLAIQSPANNGTLALVGLLPVDPGPSVGFDVYTATENGVIQPPQGYASMRVGNSYRLYEISLFSGAASELGRFRPLFQVMDLALPLGQ